jgi:hypothetical protein
MPLYRKLRGAITERGVHIYDLAGHLGVEPMTVSQRMVGRTPWKLDEVYKVMDYLEIPKDQIYDYFPPEGRVSQ